MSYKPHGPLGPCLIGYDPDEVIGPDHLARLIDKVVDCVERPEARSALGQNAYDPRMLAKLLIYAYATGTFSSRRIVQNCTEHLAYILLSRGERPCFKTVCTARIEFKSFLETVWLSLISTAAGEGVQYVGRIAVDASRFKAGASRDLVIEAKDYDAVLTRFRELLDSAARVDAEETAEGQAVRTSTGVETARITVRTAVRSTGKAIPKGVTSPRTQKRMKQCVETLSKASEQNLKHVSLTDPDARMMPIGSRRQITMGHALEVAVDSGVIVSSSSTNQASDNTRLKDLVEDARLHDPVPFVEVAADSGYFNAEQIVSLQQTGLDIVVPDSTTARQMQSNNFEPQVQTVEFKKIEDMDAYLCPQGNVLKRSEGPDANGRMKYRAQRLCTGCPLADICLSKPTVKHRNMWVRSQAKEMLAYLARFAEPEVRKQYYARGPSVETVFAFIRTILGFIKWSLRGAEKISAEATLLTCAYQVRKIQCMKLKAA